jgi:hypothetical protein
VSMPSSHEDSVAEGPRQKSCSVSRKLCGEKGAMSLTQSAASRCVRLTFWRRELGKGPTGTGRRGPGQEGGVATGAGWPTRACSVHRLQGQGNAGRHREGGVPVSQRSSAQMIANPLNLFRPFLLIQHRTVHTPASWVGTLSGRPRLVFDGT